MDIVPAILFFSPVFYFAVNALTLGRPHYMSGCPPGVGLWRLYIGLVHHYLLMGAATASAAFCVFAVSIVSGFILGSRSSFGLQVFSSPSARLIGFIICLGCADYLRSVMLTGFPWNVTAHAFLGSPILAQGASFVGQNGLNFWCCL